MRKTTVPGNEPEATTKRARILARVLAEDLQAVRGDGGGSIVMIESAWTDPPPGRDMTFVGSDAGDY